MTQCNLANSDNDSFVLEVSIERNTVPCNKELVDGTLSSGFCPLTPYCPIAPSLLNVNLFPWKCNLRKQNDQKQGYFTLLINSYFVIFEIC